MENPSIVQERDCRWAYSYTEMISLNKLTHTWVRLPLLVKVNCLRHGSQAKCVPRSTPFFMGGLQTMVVPSPSAARLTVNLFPLTTMMVSLSVNLCIQHTVLVHRSKYIQENIFRFTSGCRWDQQWLSAAGSQEVQSQHWQAELKTRCSRASSLVWTNKQYRRGGYRQYKELYTYKDGLKLCKHAGLIPEQQCLWYWSEDGTNSPVQLRWIHTNDRAFPDTTH